MNNAFLLRPLPWVSVGATGTASGFSSADLAPHPIPRMGRVFRAGTVGGGVILTFDLGADVPVDTIALFGIGDANGAPPSTWTWRVDLATEAQGSGFGAGSYIGDTLPLLAGTVLPVSGRGKALWLAPSGAPAAARHVRLNIFNPGTGQIQIALAAIGQRFQPARNYSYGAAFGVRDLGTIDYSPRGVVLRRPGAKLRGMGLTFSSIRREEVEDSLQRLFERVGNTDPVVLVSDPADHAQRQNRMGIGHLTGNLGTIHRVPGFFQAEINFVAVD